MSIGTYLVELRQMVSAENHHHVCLGSPKKERLRVDEILHLFECV